MHSLVHLLLLHLYHRLRLLPHPHSFGPIINLFLQHFLLNLMQMLNLLIKMFHLFDFSQFRQIKTFVQPPRNRRELYSLPTLVVRAGFEVCALTAEDLLVEFVVNVEDVWYSEWVLIVEFDVVDELLPYVLVAQDILEECHHLVKPPHLCYRLAPAINHPSTSHYPPTLSLYLTLFHKVYPPKCTIFEQSLFSHALAEKNFHVVDVNIQQSVFEYLRRLEFGWVDKRLWYDEENGAIQWYKVFVYLVCYYYWQQVWVVELVCEQQVLQLMRLALAVNELLLLVHQTHAILQIAYSLLSCCDVLIGQSFEYYSRRCWIFTLCVQLHDWGC